MSNLLLKYLAFFGPGKAPATLSFSAGLNVVCGASETGKSFVAESIDFMLGQESPVRDIPERDGYDRVRLAIESPGWSPITLDRSIQGGHFHAHDQLLGDETPPGEARTLRWQHSAARQDTLSYLLLERVGLKSKILRQSVSRTRSLSFRDLVRLCVVTEEEIQRRTSPLLSGQFTGATAEYAAFKLLLTGTDDSALVVAKDDPGRREQSTGKVELLNQMIEELQSDLTEAGVDENELGDQLEKLETSIAERNGALASVQKALDAVLGRRGVAANELQRRRARIVEIEELVGRFGLLDSHYETDLNRLTAIQESGSLFVYLDQRSCPLCGALPNEQHLDAQCEGNTEAVVAAARAEIDKIQLLRRELGDTVGSLSAEREDIARSLERYVQDYRSSEKELAEIAAPAVSAERASYNELVAKRAEVRASIDAINRLNRLIRQRDELENEGADPAGGSAPTRTQVSKNVLDEFSRTVEQILEEWHFPNASRVFFDEGKRDFQIAGKERGATGKGLRAISHAAVTIGLMQFCREHELPHPGFVVLDSPLLAYWKPEGAEDDLRGTDLKEMFYKYLLGIHPDNQAIIIENEHPPEFVFKSAPVTVFTKNPHQGRYGFFPVGK